MSDPISPRDRLSVCGLKLEVAPVPNLRRSILQWPMSALGQKRTFALQKGMSALALIATVKADIAL
jgi:hypothetical protein